MLFRIKIVVFSVSLDTIYSSHLETLEDILADLFSVHLQKKNITKGLHELHTGFVFA
jgi:hypothetical protein